MPRKSDSKSINNPKLDRRVKLTSEQRQSIRDEYNTGSVSQRKLAEKYGVDRRTISYVLNPEKYDVMKKQYKERRADGRYYDKEKHRQAIKEHREYKKKLYNEGKLNNENESK